MAQGLTGPTSFGYVRPAARIGISQRTPIESSELAIKKLIHFNISDGVGDFMSLTSDSVSHYLFGFMTQMMQVLSRN